MPLYAKARFNYGILFSKISLLSLPDNNNPVRQLLTENKFEWVKDQKKTNTFANVITNTETANIIAKIIANNSYPNHHKDLLMEFKLLEKPKQIDKYQITGFYNSEHLIKFINPVEVPSTLEIPYKNAVPLLMSQVIKAYIENESILKHFITKQGTSSTLIFQQEFIDQTLEKLRNHYQTTYGKTFTDDYLLAQIHEFGADKFICQAIEHLRTKSITTDSRSL